MSEEELREAIEKYKSLTNSEKIWIVDEHFFEEHDKQIRAEVIDECKTLLKTSHMIRTTEDDFSAQIEIPFYRKLWKAFEELKEQE